MRAAIADYNQSLREKGGPALAVGIGIHRGPVVAGVLGTSALKEYGVIGRTVNVAARIAARAAPGEVLVSDWTAQMAAASGVDYEEVGPAELKGIARPVPLLRAVRRS